MITRSVITSVAAPPAANELSVRRDLAGAQEAHAGDAPPAANEVSVRRRRRLRPEMKCHRAPRRERSEREAGRVIPAQAGHYPAPPAANEVSVRRVAQSFGADSA